MNNIVICDAGYCRRPVVSPALEVGSAEKPERERVSAAVGSLRVTPRGYGGIPMTNRIYQAPSARGTRAPSNAVHLVDCLDAAPRIGRGVQLLSFAGNAVMRPRLRPRPVKRLFAGFSALFFIARNEGSSMVSNDYPCIHRIKYKIESFILQKVALYTVTSQVITCFCFCCISCDNQKLTKKNWVTRISAWHGATWLSNTTLKELK